MSPVLITVLLCAAVCAVTLVASLVTGDSSWVDRLWSIVPVVYAWVFALSYRSDARLTVMAVLITLWGARLTFNFARRGGYSGYEDYRWPVLRARMTPVQYRLFTAGFIVLFQNVVLLLIVMPMSTVAAHPSGTLEPWFVVLALAFVGALVGETVADQQQWDFQRRKQAVIAAGGTPEQRFRTTGLFAVSRHPNYFFELSQWWIVFLVGVAAAGSLWQWTGVGVVLLTAIFVGSTRFTEEISLARYPEYAEYQRRVSAVVPLPPRGRGTDVVPDTGA